MIMMMNNEALEGNFQKFPSGSGGILAEIPYKNKIYHKYYNLDVIFVAK